MASRLGQFMKAVEEVPLSKWGSSWRNQVNARQIDTMNEEALRYAAKQQMAEQDAINAVINRQPSPTTPDFVVEVPDAVGTPRQVLAAQAAPMYGRNVATALESMPAESTIMSPAFLDGLLFEIDAAKGAPILLENGDPRLTAVGIKVAQSSDPMQSILALTKQDWSTADLSEGGRQYIKNLRAGNQSPVVVEPTVEVISEAPSTPPLAVVTSSKNVGSVGGGMGVNPSPIAPDYVEGTMPIGFDFGDIPPVPPQVGMTAGVDLDPGYIIPTTQSTTPTAIVDTARVEADSRPWWQKKRYIIPAAAGGLYAGATLMGNSEPEEQYYQPSPYGQMPQSFY